MPNWKKVITSGSQPALQSLEINPKNKGGDSGLTTHNANLQIMSSGSGAQYGLLISASTFNGIPLALIQTSGSGTTGQGEFIYGKGKDGENSFRIRQGAGGSGTFQLYSSGSSTSNTAANEFIYANFSDPFQGGDSYINYSKDSRSDAYFGIGTNNPSAHLHLSGNFKQVGGTGTFGENTVLINGDAGTVSASGDITTNAITASGLNLIGAGTAELEVLGNITASGNISSSGYVSASHFSGDGSGLTNITSTATVDIDGFDAFSGVPHATDDEFLISDDGTEKRATMTMVANGGFALVSGDATIAAGGALTIAADSVENSMLANMTQGTIKVGGGSNAPTDLDAKTDGQILVGDGTDINSVAVSGDVALANNGAVTIQANAVEGSMLNSNVAGTGLTVAGNNIDVDAAQTQITSVGTLTNLDVDGHITASGNISSSAYVYADRVYIGQGDQTRLAEDPAGVLFINTATRIGGAITASGNISSSGNYIGSRQFNTSTSTNQDLAQGDILYQGGGSTTTGNIVYMKTDGTWGNASNAAEGTATSLLGIALGTDPDVNGVLLRGTYTLDHDVGNNQGIPLYLSTGGQATVTAPSSDGDIIRIIGYNLGDNDEIWFDPDKTWVEHN